MRLFLSSQDFGKYAHEARKFAGSNNKALFIKNAQDGKKPEERNWSTPDKRKMFEAAGFEFEEIDLRDYLAKQKIWRKKYQKLGHFGRPAEMHLSCVELWRQAGWIRY